MAYTVFESTNMASTKYAERIFDAVAAVDVENGTFGYLDGLATGESVTYNFKVGTKAGLTIGDIVVVDQPAWTEDTSKITNQRKDKFIIKAGTRFRVRVVRKNDEFAVSIDGFTSATQATITAVTNFTTTTIYTSIDSTTGKLVAATTKPSGVIVGQIMRKRITGGTLVTTANTYGYKRDMYEIKITDVASTLGDGVGATTLGELTDVTITSATSGQVLKYDGSKWANAADATE